MKRVSMIASKSLRYGTRHLRAGDAFDAARQDARVLVAVGLASESAVPSRAPVRPQAGKAEPTPQPDVAPNELDPLRAEYEALTGSAPDRRWGATRLRGEIASAKSQADSQADLLAQSEADAE